MTKGADIDPIRPATELVPIAPLLKTVGNISAANTYNNVNDVFIQNLPIITGITLKEYSVVKVIIAKNTISMFKKNSNVLEWNNKEFESKFLNTC